MRLRRLYDLYLTPRELGAPSEVGRPFVSKHLNELFAEDDKRSSADYVGNLDFDPFVAGQDYALKDFSIASEAVAGDTATVVVRFLNFDDPIELTYRLVREAGAWKIDDIELAEPGRAWVLSRILEGE